VQELVGSRGRRPSRFSLPSASPCRARASTIAESTGRATMFLSSVSVGLIALGLVATATPLATAFYAFGLVLLPLLAFVAW
jgi:hypothetical protein